MVDHPATFYVLHSFSGVMLIKVDGPLAGGPLTVPKASFNIK